MTNFCLTELDMKGIWGDVEEGKRRKDKGIPKRRGCMHMESEEGGRNAVIKYRKWG